MVGGAAAAANISDASVMPCIGMTEEPTFDLLEGGYNSSHRRHGKLAEPAWRDRPQQGKARTVTYGAVFLHLNELAEVGEGSLHLGIDLGQRSLVDGTVQELAGKGGMSREG